ncbi:hypothetical protein GCK32_008795, partial [Trichostrongylus colubriformis]
FFQLPQSLIIRIERVGVLPSGNEFKLADHVEFGETLDVRDLCFYRNKDVAYNMAAARRPESTSRIVGGAAGNEHPLSRRPSSSGLASPFGMIESNEYRTHKWLPLRLTCYIMSVFNRIDGTNKVAYCSDLE